MRTVQRETKTPAFDKVLYAIIPMAFGMSIARVRRCWLVPLLTLLRSASSLRQHTLLSVEASPRCVRPRGGAVLRPRATAAAMGPSKKERERLVDELWASTEEETGANTAEDSHLHLELDEDGEPVLARFTYVDEHTCIGCTYCSQIARNTFFMEDEYGRARVFDQGGDSIELIEEAIDSCPVNCIHFVSHEDLVILETERSGQVINNKARLVSQQEGTSAVPPTKARNFHSGAMRCNNCPSRGCKECPMFGVGENPVYLQRLEERAEKRRKSGEAQREEEDERRGAFILDSVMADETLDVDAVNAAGGTTDTSAATEAALDALFGAPYGGDDLDDE